MNLDTMRSAQRAYDNQAEPEADETSDRIRSALETRTHDVWLSEALADYLDRGDSIYFNSQLRRHLADVIA